MPPVVSKPLIELWEVHHAERASTTDSPPLVFKLELEDLRSPLDLIRVRILTNSERQSKRESAISLVSFRLLERQLAFRSVLESQQAFDHIRFSAIVSPYENIDLLFQVDPDWFGANAQEVADSDTYEFHALFTLSFPTMWGVAPRELLCKFPE